MADELDIRNRELAKELLDDLGITEALKGKFENQPAQAEELLKEYHKYYKQAFEVFFKPSGETGPEKIKVQHI